MCLNTAFSPWFNPKYSDRENHCSLMPKIYNESINPWTRMVSKKNKIHCIYKGDMSIVYNPCQLHKSGICHHTDWMYLLYMFWQDYIFLYPLLVQSIYSKSNVITIDFLSYTHSSSGFSWLCNNPHPLKMFMENNLPIY